ncbi:hypothetical protein KS4_29770 [Poriferisphaera corsica]|uniref:KAP NTPase domain-containing protein n=1 Tax=Poriferisphaera corsica TaxID=2528020 RepID=A0A517YXG6_9BACT|nr:P-loop NTPase fold protein [Poriferisphaera corsica]QDU34900.1 hypothetical protein KS4_29770 [Poriferisphaera corsica]
MNHLTLATKYAMHGNAALIFGMLTVIATTWAMTMTYHKETLKENRQHRRYVHRWVDIFLLSCVAASICIFTLPHLERLSVGFILHTQFLHHAIGISILTWADIFAIPIITLAILYLHHHGAFRKFGNFGQYPSIIFAIILVLIVVLIARQSRLAGPQYHAFVHIDWIVLSILIALPATFMAGIWHNRYLHSKNNEDPHDQDHDLTNISPHELLAQLTVNDKAWQEMKSWFNDTRPITIPENDKFGARRTAKQIANVFAQPINLSNKQGAAIGLIGPFGSGKSSVIEMAKNVYKRKYDKLKDTEQYTDNPTHYPLAFYIPIKTWGIEPETLTHHMLDAAISKLRMHMDTIGFSRLAEHYVQAVNATSVSWLQSLAALLRTHKDPENILKNINHALQAINRQIIFVIEDIDRAELSDSQLRKQHLDLQAMMDHLNECSHFNFIISISQSAFDVNRLCKTRIKLLSIDAELTGAILQAFRYRCLQTALTNNILFPDITENEINRIKNLVPSQSHHMTEENSSKYDYDSVWTHVIPLLCNPRRLTNTLNQTLSAWGKDKELKKLRGEVNFDELLIVETLRTTYPQAVDFIDRIKCNNYSPAEHMKNKEEEKETSNKINKSKTELNLLLKTIDQNDRTHVIEIISHFTGLYSNRGEIRSNGLDSTAQKTKCGRQTDIYWHRLFESYPTQDKHLTDQEILHGVSNWQNDKEHQELPEKLFSDNHYLSKFIHLHKHAHNPNPECILGCKKLRKLLKSIYKYALTKKDHGIHFNQSTSIYQILEIALKDKQRSVDDVFTWYITSVNKEKSSNLSLAVHLLWINEHEDILNPTDVDSVVNTAINSWASSMLTDGKHGYDILFDALPKNTLINIFCLKSFVQYSQTINYSELYQALQLLIDNHPKESAPYIAAMLFDTKTAEHNMYNRGIHDNYLSYTIDFNFVTQLIPQVNDRLAILDIIIARLNYQLTHTQFSDKELKRFYENAISELSLWRSKGAL